MNSYYSNRIEGQGTHPLNIERALHRQFSDKPDVARLQRVAVAHIEAEIELEQLVANGESPMAAAFLIEAHHALYSRLAEEDRTTEDGRIQAANSMNPGFRALRRTECSDVQRHGESMSQRIARVSREAGKRRVHA